MAALGCFISRLGDKALPFFKVMKKTGTSKWTPETAAAFEDLKKYLASLPIMVAPKAREPLLLYLAATPQTASAVLVAEREEPALLKEKAPLAPAQAPGQQGLPETPGQQGLSELPVKKGLPEPPKEQGLPKPPNEQGLPETHGQQGLPGPLVKQVLPEPPDGQ